jgi:DNA invertase Pin-like site-specific DNA recombinase
VDFEAGTIVLAETKPGGPETIAMNAPARQVLKCFLDMLGAFAEFETNLRRERQLEGIAKAKAAGIYKGRPASIDAARVRELKAQGLGPTEIAKALKIGRASVYRVLEATA